MTKEMWENSVSVNPQQEREFKQFTNDRNTYPRMDEDEEYEYFREMEELRFEEAMNNFFENNY
jgi:hypothetical protein